MSINPTKLILGILTPVVSAAAGWLCAAAAKYGVHLDPSGVNALAVAGASAGAAAMVKLIHDVESKPKVEKVVHEVEAKVDPVAKAVVAVDPAAPQQAEGALTAAEQAVIAEYRKIVGRIPEPPPAWVAAPPVSPAAATITSAPPGAQVSGGGVPPAAA